MLASNLGHNNGPGTTISGLKEQHCPDHVSLRRSGLASSSCTGQDDPDPDLVEKTMPKVRPTRTGSTSTGPAKISFGADHHLHHQGVARDGTGRQEPPAHPVQPANLFQLFGNTRGTTPASSHQSPSRKRKVDIITNKKETKTVKFENIAKLKFKFENTVDNVKSKVASSSRIKFKKKEQSLEEES